MRVIWLPVIALGLAGCADRQLKQADAYASKGELTKAITEYRGLLNRSPHDIELKNKLLKMQLYAADQYYHQGEKHLALNNYEAAIGAFQDALTCTPEYEKAAVSLRNTIQAKDAAMLLHESELLAQADKPDQAIAVLQKGLKSQPTNRLISDQLLALQQKQSSSVLDIDLLSNKAISLNLKQVDLRSAFEFIAKSYNINILFDEGVKNTPFTLYAKNVTFIQSMDMLLSNSKTFYKKVGPNTILIIPDTKEKRDQYQELIIKSYSLNHSRAKEMADIIKGILTVRKLSVNESLNSIMVRDTKEVLNTIDRIINLNDRKPAEVLVDVEILEINRSKAERLGIDFGSEIKATYSNLPIASSFAKGLQNGSVVIPATTFRYFKQDVDAKSLATPKIRVTDGKAAKILIGDRVPLRASTVVDATGQTRTTYEYKDIGIKLNVEPDIHLDDSTSIKVGLEVSALGENLGTVNEPAFRIGTRNAESVMVLRDGETAVIGGLMRDEERNTRVKVPGFGSIPILGTLFTSADDSGGVTDIVLTITPRIIRSRDVAPAPENQIYSGTEQMVLDRPLFQGSASAANDEAGNAQTSSVTTSDNFADGDAGGQDKADVMASNDLGFDSGSYQFAVGTEASLALEANAIQDLAEGHVDIIYNPGLLDFSMAADKLSDDVQIDASKPGNLRVDFGPLGKGHHLLANLKWRTHAPGASYITFKSPYWLTVAKDRVIPIIHSTQLTVHDNAKNTGTDAH